MTHYPPGWQDGDALKNSYLYPTKRGAYLWIWVLNSDGLTASLLDDVHMVWISLANSDGVGWGANSSETRIETGIAGGS